MFSKTPCIILLLLFVSTLLWFPPDLPAADETSRSQDPLDLQPIANTRWLLTHSFEDYDWTDQLVLGSEVFTFSDGTVYLECYDQAGYFWGIVQYGALASHDGKSGYMVTYYNYGESDSDGTYFLWEFIKTNGLETGNFAIEYEATGALSESLPNIAVRINDNFAPAVVHEVTNDDKIGLADVIWSLQTLAGVR